MDELLTQFLIEGRELVADAHVHLEALGTISTDAAHIDGAFRAFHTLKGSVGLFDMAPAVRILHAGEDLLEQARAGRLVLDHARIATLVDCIDHLDRWIDALEHTGGLPSEAAEDAAAMAGRLDGEVGAQDDALPASEIAPAGADWLPDLLESAALLIGDEHRDLLAFRYVPDSQSFFRGDDPLKIVLAVPGVIALRTRPREPWPEPDEIAPFECNLVIDGVTTEALDAVRLAFRAVGDEVEIVPVPRQQERELDSAPGSGRSLRIDESRIDSLADDVGELVLVGNALSQLSADVGRLNADLGAKLRLIQGSFERTLGSLHRSVRTVRMVALGPALRRLPRIVREIAADLGRSVGFTIEGEGTEVDKAIADMLYEPLLHLVRNAVDHGIEPPEVRRAAGKPEQGQVRLMARRIGEHVVIELSDDGAGMDPDRIRTIAVERGLVAETVAADLADAALFQLVFAPGFSTARSVTSVSGRGVGMDAVKTAVEAIGGAVLIASDRGRGTITTLRLPLSAITTRLLLVRSGADRYGVPFHTILETANIRRDTIVPIGAGEAFVLRDRTLPIIHLAALLGATRSEGDRTKLLIVQAETDRVALAVDGFEDQIEALVRPPSKLLSGLPAIAGTTVLGDGQVLLVLDPARLVA